MDFGMRTNAAELGVKHVQLAEGRGVVSAGEIQIAADGTVRFNNESGSYARDISGRIGAKNLAEKTRQAFRAHGIDPQSGLPKIEAEALTPGDLRELCAVSLFIQNNPHLCSMAH
jgi:hypothetical protein